MTASTLPPAARPRTGPLFRRAMLSSLAVVAVVGGPFLVPHWRELAADLSAPHAPNLAPIAEAGLAVQIHLATVSGAIVIAVVLLSGIKGSRLHRTLGWTWSLFMLTTAIATLFIRPAAGMPSLLGFGPLHLFAAGVLIVTPLALIAARRHRAVQHGRMMSSLVSGGLVLAGVFAFLPGRLLWRVFFG